MFNIQEELKKLPLKPGVYIMKNKNDEILYIGKAGKLKNRVRQYFQVSANHTLKIRKMVEQISSFEYIITASELEALILECNLIKVHKPKYNTMLKDDKNYPYIKITSGEEFPRIIFTREIKKDKSKYFGPYTSGNSAKETMELLRKIWKVRSCNRNLPKDIGKERPCLYYHINQCTGPCQGYISSEEYRKNIEEVLVFLGGKFQPTIDDLTNQMKEFSENLEFEKAAEIRNQIRSIKNISQKQIMSRTSDKDQDIIGFAKEDEEVLVQIFFIRNGKMIGREQFRLNMGGDSTDQDIMEAFIKQFYSGTPYIPKEILIQVDINDIEIIEKWLSDRREQKVTIKTPIKGEKSRLVELAEKNAKISLLQFKEHIKEKETKTKIGFKEMQELLSLKEEILRIEAYDISNTQGFESVGSMVVFENGIPKRSDYRKFKIKTVKGSNDYKSIEEVLKRRLKNALKEQEDILLKKMDISMGKFTKLPDLILVDGGKGHVNIVRLVLDDMGLDIPVCGMVKDDKHNTRGLIYKDEEINIKKTTSLFRLIVKIQDEAHRFAIEYHRKLRSTNQVKSVLDEIDGVGETRRKNLVKYFGSIEKIKNAEIEELEKVESINNKVAKEIYDFFRKN